MPECQKLVPLILMKFLQYSCHLWGWTQHLQAQFMFFCLFLCHISQIYLSLLTSVAFDWLPHVHFDVSNMKIRQWLSHTEYQKTELRLFFRISWNLSSPRAKRAGPKGLRAESARALTGRRNSHRWEGGRLFEPSAGFFYRNSCNFGTKSRKIVSKVGN